MRQVVIPATFARTPALACPGERRQLAGETMGTTWQVCLYGSAEVAAAARASVEQTLRLVVRQMSHWEPGSDLSRFNAAAPGTPVALPEPLFGLLQRAQRIAALSEGAFDPAAGALVRRWGFGPDRARLDPEFRIPDAAEIATLRDRGGWQRLRLEPVTRQVVQPGGLELDLSAIAKGYAVDLVSERLVRDGCVSHLVEIGGELRAAGLKPDAQPWWVALEQPVADAGLDEALVALCDRAIATSGSHRRWFEHSGRRYAHTLDPRRGSLVDNDLVSVTVLGEECWHADAVSTALMVMGADQGREFADRHGFAMRVVRRTPQGYREDCSRAWREMLQ